MKIAHIVRDFGGLTEPFISDRIRSTPGSILWAERFLAPAPDGIESSRVDIPAMRPGSLGDKAFFHFPSIGPALAGPYGAQESRDSPDLIHAHYLSTGYLVARRTKAPMVISTYGFDISILPRRHWWRTGIPSLAARADRFLVEGPAMSETLQHLGISARHISIVPIALDLTATPDRLPRVDADEVRLIACGRFVEKKGFEIAIEALAAIGSTLPIRLEIVGDGPLRSRLEESVERHGLARTITFRGPLARQAYLERLRASDILLAPSRTARNGDSEGGAPTTILDAQASGVLVIGSTHADIPFLIQDGETGFLFEEGSASSLVDAIRRAVSSKHAWAKITAKARQQVEGRHALDRIGANLTEIYRQVVQ